MRFKTIYQIVLIFSILLPVAVSGQISHGGVPIQIKKLKSWSPDADLVVMPTVDNQTMRNMNSSTSPNMLKSFHFAHPFPVSLTPENSGKWYATDEVNVWQLRIRSVGAYSLNLIFDRYNLPENARLFLISEKTGELKGAYTSDNNSDSQIFAVEPIEGDELIVQYEEPTRVKFSGELRISQVAHDFIGVTASDAHRPLGISGSCNVNVNCDLANGTENIRDAVCRILVEGTELCSGTLINNTAMDGIPYVLTANHCIRNDRQAQSSIFLFNYESPSCSTIDGDVSRSLSGSTLKAAFDSLDFTLVLLNTIPPYNYRSYMAGWNRKNTAPTSSICIHHPLGDIKKIAIDSNAPKTSSFNINYYPNGFWQVLRWDNGVTEAGSSGGPLFDQNNQLVGTLTGGLANCTLPTNDYFEKFALAWNHRKEKEKQLKAWLDPLSSNVETLTGMSLDTGINICMPFTNIKNNDTPAAIQIINGTTNNGYWSGTNRSGFTDFAEKYTFSKNSEVQGVSLGIAKKTINSSYLNSYIGIEIYSGTDKPETLLYSETFRINTFYNDAMNYVSFENPVKTVGTFFVSYNISLMNEGDTLAVYMAKRESDTTNSFYLKNQDGWSTYNSQSLDGNGSALLMEIIVCNVDDTTIGEDTLDVFPEVRFFPNPLYGSLRLNVQTVDTIDCPEDIAVYDLLGKKQNIPWTLNDVNRMSLDFSGQRPGIYLIHLECEGRSVVGKISYTP
ncbi:MAG TPA: trypsin-like peptidase domain-containing protein [Prolixibacteraceae bacterium]|nr:trypsin-like peptidase domain-containing protein [Prolixibacteraceae bacterium]